MGGCLFGSVGAASGVWGWFSGWGSSWGFYRGLNRNVALGLGDIVTLIVFILSLPRDLAAGKGTLILVIGSFFPLAIGSFVGYKICNSFKVQTDLGSDQGGDKTRGRLVFRLIRVSNSPYT